MVVVSGKVDTTSSGSIRGSGLVRFSQSLSSERKSVFLDLQAGLPRQSSSLTIISHSTDRNLNDGLRITFSRFGNTLRGAIQIGTSLSRIDEGRLSQQLPNNMAFTLEIRNSGNMVRVLMWPFNPRSREDRDAFFDSFQTNHLDRSLPLESGKGVNFGMNLDDAEVFSARPF